MPKSKKGRDQDGEDSDDDLDDEEVSLGSMDEDFEDGEEFMDIEDDDDDDDDDAGAQPAKKKKKGKMEDQSVFASSEEFGCLLEENTSLKFDNIDMNAMANKDKADVKQLKWEVQRNDWIRDRDVQTLRQQKGHVQQEKVRKGQVMTRH